MSAAGQIYALTPRVAGRGDRNRAGAWSRTSLRRYVDDILPGA
jgi:hypothetical protein